MLVDAYNGTHPKAAVQPAALVASDEFGRPLDPDASVFDCFDEGDDLIFMAEGGGGTLETLKSELSALGIGTLSKRARESGVDDARLLEAQDSDDPKPAIIALILENSAPAPNYIEHSRKKAGGHSHYYWDNTAERRSGGAGGAAQPAKPKPAVPKKVAAVARPASSGDEHLFRTIGLHPRAFVHAPVVIAHTRTDDKGCR